MSDLPSVTRILKAVGLGPDLSAVPVSVLELARQRGVALHQAIQWHHEGTLDEASLHPEIAPGFSAYLKFLAETQHAPVVSEAELVHPTWHYKGHPDRVGFHGATRWLLDFKYQESVDIEATAYQLAGYRLLWAATHPQEPLDAVAIVQLKRDGTYRLHCIEKHRWSNDDQVFQAALVVCRAQRRGNNGPSA